MYHQDWKQFVVSDPYGPLLATKGIDPSSFGYTSLLREAIKAHLRSDIEWLPLVRETKRRLRQRWYDSDSLDGIIQGVQVTDEEVWGFLQVWAMLGECQVASMGFEMPCEPPDNIADAASIVARDFRQLKRIRVEMRLQDPRDTERRGLDAIILSGTIPLDTPVRVNRGNSLPPESEIRSEVSAVFLPGPCSALYFYEQLTEHIPIFRWPAGQRRAMLYVPRVDRVEKRTDPFDDLLHEIDLPRLDANQT